MLVADAFLWWRRGPDLGPGPWLVLSSPPYDFDVHRLADMLELLGGIVEKSPPGSLLVVESDERFDFARLPEPAEWDIRRYPPAVIGIYEKIS